MKCAALATLSALILSASAIPVSEPEQIAKRVSGPCPNGTCGDVAVPIVDFTAYTGWDCQSTDVYATYHYIRSQASDECHQLGGGSVTVHGVSQTFGNLKCQLTVYTKSDCSDPGQQIGAPQGPGAAPGCSSDAGGWNGYKVQCPWW